MPRSNPLALLILLIVAFTSFTAASSPAYSQEIWKSCKWLEPDAGGAGGNAESVGKVFGICDEYKGLTNKAVKCITRVFMEATAGFIEDLQPYFDDLLKAVMTLYVVMFGIRIAMGELTPQHLRYEAPLFLLKFGIVMYFIAEIVTWYSYAICGTGDMLEIVTSSLSTGMAGKNGAGGSFTMSMACSGQLNAAGCVDLSAPAGNMDNYAALTNQTNGVWNFMDCLLGSFISFSPAGISATESTSAQVGVIAMLPLGMSAFGMIIASSLSGYIGMAVFFAGITSLVAMLFSIFKAAFHFLVAMLGLSFYFAISGFAFLCLPLRATSKFFFAWLGGVVQYMMFPLILVVFLTLAIWLYDWALFRSDQSLMREIFQKDEICPEDIKALNESGFLRFDVMNAANYGKNSLMRTDLPTDYQKLLTQTSDTPEMQAQRISPYTFNQLQNRLPGLNIKSHPVFKVGFAECMKEEACAKDLQEYFMTGLLGSLITLSALTYVVMSFLDLVPNLAKHLANSVGSAFGSRMVPFSQMQAPLEKNVNAGIEAMRDKAKELGTDATLMGPASQQRMEEFMRQAPKTFSTSFAGNNLFGDIIKNAFESGSSGASGDGKKKKGK